MFIINIVFTIIIIVVVDIVLFITKIFHDVTILHLSPKILMKNI